MTEHISAPKNIPSPAPGTKPSDDPSPFEFNKLNYFSVLFILLLSAMSNREETVYTASKEISANATAQNRLNALNAAIRYVTLPPNATQGEIDRVQDQNQQITAIRSDIQNALLTTRQTGQVMMTQASTNVDILQQDASQTSGLLDTMKTILQEIADITQM